MQPKHNNTISSLGSSKKIKNNISFIIDIPNNELEFENINCSLDAVDNSILSNRENGTLIIEMSLNTMKTNIWVTQFNFIED